jgi:cytoskeletal protein CcmA (bactofilin family)
MSSPVPTRSSSRIPLAIGVLAVGALSVSALAVGMVLESPGARASDARTTAAVGALQGPQFVSGSSIDMVDDVDGDVYAAGQSITISGDVTGDVIAAAQTITITGTVDGDVRVAAQDVVISGAVARSGTVAASSISVTDTGSVGTDLVGVASTTGISGAVGRDVRLSVDRLMIDGTVGRDLVYDSDTVARIADGAVTGSMERIVPTPATEVEVSGWAAVAGWLLGLLYALIALSFVTLAAGLLLPRLLHRVTDRLVPSPWTALLVGAIASFAVPAALFALLVSVVGAPIALAGVLVWTVLTLATFVFGAAWIGRLMFHDRRSPLVSSLVGGVILITALQIPWLNVLVWIGMVWFGLGAQLLELHARRPWRVAGTRPEAVSGPTPAPTSPLAPIATSPVPGSAPAPAPEPEPEPEPARAGTA